MSSATSEQRQEEYENSMDALAKKGIYEFEFVEGDKTGQKIRLERHKISNRMMRELEIDRAEYGALVDKFSNGKANITKDERHQAAIMLTDLYTKMAHCYFEISKDDFELMDWDSTKFNIDAAANISLRGRPNVVQP